MTKAISNSNPSVSIQNGGGNSPEPILVGSANQMIRFVGMVMLAVIIALVYFSVENIKLINENAKAIGVLTEKVRTLEDIVINKTLEVK